MGSFVPITKTVKIKGCYKEWGKLKTLSYVAFREMAFFLLSSSFAHHSVLLAKRSEFFSRNHLCIYTYIYVYTHPHIHTHTVYCISKIYIYLYIYIYINIRKKSPSEVFRSVFLELMGEEGIYVFLLLCIFWRTSDLLASWCSNARSIHTGAKGFAH